MLSILQCFNKQKYLTALEPTALGKEILWQKNGQYWDTQSFLYWPIYSAMFQNPRPKYTLLCWACLVCSLGIIWFLTRYIFEPGSELTLYCHFDSTTDINECSDPTICQQGSRCDNTYGSYKCTSLCGVGLEYHPFLRRCLGK